MGSSPKQRESELALITRVRAQLDTADAFVFHAGMKPHSDWVCCRREDIAALCYLADQCDAWREVAAGVRREAKEREVALKAKGH